VFCFYTNLDLASEASKHLSMDSAIEAALP
jgi:hypothetical protein